ncbi:type II toxin-antitoxin system VapC family toxin [Lacisediminimonas sp.]|uniref:type II toxin-antitoxin system VapC family toxin n=1 Tax=Lacisediminimonas sp. TaxID=3060582 RepID=UPI002721DCC0|nr:type II toxin-antitoxin system VapC family toxin [Lacisediminimonas sp.]MDO8298846.1 type II toxin-antitoxin system VapC family toxin [Lacisediminimonas sp.]
MTTLYLLDTNILSDFRKGPRAHPGVRLFFESVDDASLFVPVQVIGEIQSGIQKLRRRKDHPAAFAYEQWLDTLRDEFAGRIIDFDRESARMWGVLLSGEKGDPHTIDKQIAAMAMVRGMTVVTGDRGVAFRGFYQLQVVNPMASVASPGAD